MLRTGRADAEVQVLRGERVGRYGGHFLLVRSAVESQLVECGDDGVAAQATGGELLAEFLGDIGGHQGDGLVVDVAHPADGQHLCARTPATRGGGSRGWG